MGVPFFFSLSFSSVKFQFKFFLGLCSTWNWDRLCLSLCFLSDGAAQIGILLVIPLTPLDGELCSYLIIHHHITSHLQWALSVNASLYWVMEIFIHLFIESLLGYGRISMWMRMSMWMDCLFGLQGNRRHIFQLISSRNRVKQRQRHLKFKYHRNHVAILLSLFSYPSPCHRQSVCATAASSLLSITST